LGEEFLPGGHTPALRAPPLKRGLSVGILSTGTIIPGWMSEAKYDRITKLKKEFGLCNMIITIFM